VSTDDRVQAVLARWRLVALSAARVRAMAVAVALAGTLAVALVIASAAAAGPSFLVPASRAGFPSWLAGPLAGAGPAISQADFSVLMLAMCACFAVVLAWGEVVERRWIVAAIAGVHLIFAIAPPLLSFDVFGYLDYARLGAVHDLNPYANGASAAPDDPVHRWVVWHYLPSPYGPLFTVPTYLLGAIDFRAGMWLIKVAAALASLGCVALVWRAAERLGRSPVAPAVFVGLNPLLLVWGVGGAHNDLFLALLLALAVERTLARGDAAAGAAVAAAAAIKLTAGLALPFMLIGRDGRRRALAGALGALAVVCAAGFAVLGTGLLDFPSALAEQRDLISARSVPNYLALEAGLDGPTTAMRLIAAAGFVAAFAFLLARTWRGASWIASAGWATVALLLTTTWLMPWYIAWLLPLAALAPSPRLRAATLALTGYVILTRLHLLIT